MSISFCHWYTLYGRQIHLVLTFVSINYLISMWCFCLLIITSLLAGVHSFDYLGLGYQIDWPVSIVLTPAALKLYSDIFNFLIQVKLAVSALSDVWCSLKVLFLFHFVYDIWSLRQTLVPLASVCLCLRIFFTERMKLT